MYKYYSREDIEKAMLDILCEYGTDANGVTVIKALRDALFQAAEDKAEANNAND